MPDSPQQLSLFDAPPEPEPQASAASLRDKPQPGAPIPTAPAPETTTPLDQARAAKNKTRLNAHTSLAKAVEAYHDHIAGSELSPHTVK